MFDLLVKKKKKKRKHMVAKVFSKYERAGRGNLPPPFESIGHTQYLGILFCKGRKNTPWKESGILMLYYLSLDREG